LDLLRRDEEGVVGKIVESSSLAEYVQVFYIPRDDSGELEILLRPRNEGNVNWIVWEDVRNVKGGREKWSGL
jgi:hypothetical protein